jgi:tetratricopeptide (TPR) repeat protein
VSLLLAGGVAAALANFVAWPVAAGLGLASGGVTWLGGVLLQGRAERQVREEAWYAAVTSGPGGNNYAEGNEVVIDLLPERQVVPYSPSHEPVLRTLVSRTGSEGPAREHIVVVEGGPGSGKTRLLVEAAQRIRSRCGWVIPGRGAAAIEAAAALKEPAVLIVDDADSRPDVEALLTAFRHANAPAVFVVLAARRPNLWWSLIRELLPAHVLGALPARAQLSVPDFVGGEREQRQMFDKALRFFTPRGAPVPDADLVSQDPAPSIVIIHAAAALAARSRHDGMVTVTSVASEVFRIEQRRWRSTAEQHGLGMQPDSVLRRVVMMAALVGAADAPAADSLLSHLPELAGPVQAHERRALAGWVREIYPQQVPDWIAPRLPAVLLEQYASVAIQEDHVLVAAIISATRDDDERAYRAITALGRAVTHRAEAKSAVHTVLAAGGHRMTSVAVAAVATTGVPLDEVIAACIDDQGRQWTADQLNEIVQLIPGRARYRLLAATVVTALRGYVSRANTEADALQARQTLATELEKQGRYQEAEAEHRVVLTTQTKALGADHADTLKTRHQIAIMLGELGSYEKADAALEAVLTAQTKALGADHPDTLATRRSLALAQVHQPRHEQAVAELRAVLTSQAAVLGAKHEETLSTRSTLAYVLDEQGRYQESEAEYRSVLEVELSERGAEHPRTLDARHGIAAALYGQGRYEEAEAEVRAVLAARTTVLGAEHPETLGTHNALAVALDELGRLQEAEAEYRAVVAARTRILGAEHANTLRSRHSLALVFARQERYEQADAEFREVLAAQSSVFGAGHPDALRTRFNLANILLHQRRYDEAEVEFGEVLAARTAVLGAEHPETLGTRHNLAVVFGMQERYEEAEAAFQTVLDARVASLGAEHPDTLETRHNLAAMIQARDTGTA